MSIRLISAEKFSQVLLQHLVKAFGQVPTASAFADQFNLRAYGAKTITRESARKWIRGEVIPNWQNLSVLMNWLGIDPSLLYERHESADKQKDAPIAEKRDISHDHLVNAIADILRDMQPNNARILALVALALRDSKQIDDEALTKLLQSVWASGKIDGVIFSAHSRH